DPVSAIVREGERPDEPPRHVRGLAERRRRRIRLARDGPAGSGLVHATMVRAAGVLGARVPVVALGVVVAACRDRSRRAADERVAGLLRAGITVVGAHGRLAEIARAVVAEVERAGIVIVAGALGAAAGTDAALAQVAHGAGVAVVTGREVSQGT